LLLLSGLRVLVQEYRQFAVRPLFDLLVTTGGVFIILKTSKVFRNCSTCLLGSLLVLFLLFGIGLCWLGLLGRCRFRLCAARLLFDRLSRFRFDLLFRLFKLGVRLAQCRGQFLRLFVGGLGGRLQLLSRSSLFSLDRDALL